MIANLWRGASSKKIFKTYNVGDGINTFNPPIDILDTQASDLRNVNSSKYPALNVRNGKTQISTAITTPNALGQRNNSNIHIVDGKAWKYWNGSSWVAVKTLSTDALGTFEEFSTGTTKYTIFSNGTDREAWNGTSTTSLTNAPASKIFITHKGRIYWARDNDIVFSGLNLINDYTAPDDAGSIDVTRAKGALTSLYEYNDRVIAWTEYSMHALYGTKPANFELLDIEGEIGNLSDRSTVVANKKLYWMWYDGIYEFDGSTPIKVSEPFYINGANANGVTGGVTSYIKNIKFSLKEKIVGGSFGDYLYMSVPYGSSATNNNLTFAFDTKLRKWYIRDEGFIDFETIGNTLYGIDTAGKLWDMTTAATTDGGTAISWYYITKAFSEGVPSSKVSIAELWVIFDLPSGSTLNIAYSKSIDNDDFVNCYTATANSDEQNVRVQLPVTALQNVNWYRIKISGTGPCTVYAIEKKYRVKFKN